MWRPEIDAVSSLLSLGLEMVPCWTPDSTNSQRAPRRFVLLCFLNSRVSGTHSYAFTKKLGIELRSSSWGSQPFPDWASTPAPAESSYIKKATLKSLECRAVKSNCYTFGILCVPGNIHLLPPPPLHHSFPFTLKWSLAVMRVPLSTEPCLIISMLNGSDSSQSQGFWVKGDKVWHRGPLTTCGKLSFMKFHITRKMKKCEECLRGQGTEPCPSIVLVCLTHLLAALIILTF